MSAVMLAVIPRTTSRAFATVLTGCALLPGIVSSPFGAGPPPRAAPAAAAGPGGAGRGASARAARTRSAGRPGVAAGAGRHSHRCVRPAAGGRADEARDREMAAHSPGELHPAVSLI